MDDMEGRGYASPPCYLHELGTAELVAQLNELIEGERAGAKGLKQLTSQGNHDELNTVLAQVGRDEARFCAMLRRHVIRLGGAPSDDTGAFLDKLLARESLEDRLQLLDRGQSVVVRVLEQLLEQPLDRELRQDLDDMRRVHVQNIERCARFLS